LLAYKPGSFRTYRTNAPINDSCWALSDNDDESCGLNSKAARAHLNVEKSESQYFKYNYTNPAKNTLQIDSSSGMHNDDAPLMDLPDDKLYNDIINN
jgi:hypothetical protein